jgi:hypothetical protein
MQTQTLSRRLPNRSHTTRTQRTRIHPKAFKTAECSFHPIRTRERHKIVLLELTECSFDPCAINGIADVEHRHKPRLSTARTKQRNGGFGLLFRPQHGDAPTKKWTFFQPCIAVVDALVYRRQHSKRKGCVTHGPHVPQHNRLIPWRAEVDAPDALSLTSHANQLRGCFFLRADRWLDG